MTHIQNDKQALLCLRFVYLFRFLFLIDEYSLLPPADILYIQLFSLKQE